MNLIVCFKFPFKKRICVYAFDNLSDFMSMITGTASAWNNFLMEIVIVEHKSYFSIKKFSSLKAAKLRTEVTFPGL